MNEFRVKIVVFLGFIGIFGPITNFLALASIDDPNTPTECRQNCLRAGLKFPFCSKACG